MGKLSHLRNELNAGPSPEAVTVGASVALAKRIKRLESGLLKLAKMVADVESSVKSIDFPEIPDNTESFASLSEQIQSAIKAVQAIPEPSSQVLSPPSEVDLEPLFSRLSDIAGKVDSIEFPEMELSMPKRDFEFEIIRNNFGLIEKVIAKEL